MDDFIDSCLQMGNFAEKEFLGRAFPLLGRRSDPNFYPVVTLGFF